MSQALPYNFNQQENNYRFQTDAGVYYSVSFTDGSFYFNDFPPYLSVFEFSISVVSLGDNISPPHDRRVEATVVMILKDFLSDHENSVIYVCETLDQRQQARHRKFDMWFKQNLLIIPDLEKHDIFVTYENLEIIASLIIHKNNLHKGEVIKMFFDQAKDLDKDE